MTRAPRCAYRATGGGDGRGCGGTMTSVSGTDFLAEAAAELYSSDPEGFTERRAALAAQARAAGDRPAAKEIASLRKPTRPASIINQLVRGDPGVVARLTGLGDDLRAAATALDGAKIRELSQARRRLIDSLIRQALQQAGEHSPSAALREDLTATFGAALADPDVARELAAGTLLRPVHRADFGAGIPGLSLVPPPAEALRKHRRKPRRGRPGRHQHRGPGSRQQRRPGTRPPAAPPGWPGRRRPRGSPGRPSLRGSPGRLSLRGNPGRRRMLTRRGPPGNAGRRRRPRRPGRRKPRGRPGPRARPGPRRSGGRPSPGRSRCSPRPPRRPTRPPRRNGTSASMSGRSKTSSMRPAAGSPGPGAASA